MEAPDIRHISDLATPGDNIATAEASGASGTGIRTDGMECSANVHQRRRVNPESLALRLGPDLVRDLDALITPGNTEMPSFAVRKELQERYNIDRRHIYDYFHSRGLRVVKEDKHGNPMAVKDFPTPLVTCLSHARSSINLRALISLIFAHCDKLPSKTLAHTLCTLWR